MKRIAATVVLLTALGLGTAPAFARDAYVIDNAGLLSASTVSALNAKIADFNAQTHKEVVVDTESTVTGDPKAAAEQIFAQQQINGVLIYIAKTPKTIGVIPDRAAAKYFPAGSTSAIRTAIADGFNAGNFDGGVTNGVDLTLNMYRSHLGSLRSAMPAPAAVTTTRSDTGGGFSMGWIWWLIVLAVIFFIIRGIFRAMAGPRMMPPGYGGGPMGPMGGGYGPGYGGGGFGGGGGGSFFSGLLGGLGGAFLGNELFGNRGETIVNPGQQAGFGDQSSYNAGDQSGFQSDPGQADMGNSSFGGWGGGGDSSGGWGGGDSGGGGWGGGDSGGGGGDSGGGGW